MKSKILAILALSSLLTTVPLLSGFQITENQISTFKDKAIESFNSVENFKNALILNRINNLHETTRNWSSKPTWGQYLHYGTYIMAGIGAYQFFLNNFTLNKTNNLIGSIFYGGLIGAYYANQHKILKTDFEKNKDAYKKKLDEITPNTSTLIALPGTLQEISADDITELTTACTTYSQHLHREQANRNIYHYKKKVTKEQFDKLNNPESPLIAPVNAAYQSELQKKYNRDLLLKASLFAATTGAVIYYCRDDLSELIQKF